MARRRSQAVSRDGQEQIPGWIWLLGGVFIGALLAALTISRGWLPEPRTSAESVEPSAAPTNGLDDELPVATDTRPPFAYPTLLPEMEVLIPDQPTQAPRADLLTAAEPGRLLLQVGALPTEKEADQLRARLVLLGQRAFVQRVTVDERLWFRVRVGPFSDPQSLEEARQALLAEGLRAQPVREAPTPPAAGPEPQRNEP